MPCPVQDLEIAERESTAEELRTLVEEASATGRVGAVLVTSARQERGASFGTQWRTEYAVVTDVVDYRSGLDASLGSVDSSARMGLSRGSEDASAAKCDYHLSLKVEVEGVKNRGAVCKSAEAEMGEERDGLAAASKRLGKGTKRKHTELTERVTPR